MGKKTIIHTREKTASSTNGTGQTKKKTYILSHLQILTFDVCICANEEEKARVEVRKFDKRQPGVEEGGKIQKYENTH